MNQKNTKYISSVFMPLAGIFLFFVIVLLIVAVYSPNIGETLAAFFAGPWKGLWFAGNTLDSICLLLTASLGVSASLQAGCLNLGCNGQIYAGGLAASCVLLALPDSAAALGVAALAAVFVGGLIGGIAGFFKKYAGADEIITTFLISSAITPVADYLIGGPLRDSSGNLLATRAIPVLPRILPPSNLSVSFIFTLILVFAGHFLIKNTVFGYRLKIAGASARFARYAGIEASRSWLPALVLSGALAGLAGFFAAAGTYGRCYVGFAGGLGWNAIAVALIARNLPLLLIPAAFVYGSLESGSRSAMLAAGMRFETSSFIQAAVLLFATARLSSRVYQNRRKASA